MIRKQADSYGLSPFRDGLCKFRAEAMIRNESPKSRRSPHTETLERRRMVKKER